MDFNRLDFEQGMSTEMRFRNSVEQAPMGIAILRGPEMIVEMANARYLELVDRNREALLGISLYEGVPEVKEAVKPLLDEVISTGMPHHGNDFPVILFRKGQLKMVYFNFVYQPLRNTTGVVDGVMVVATDVTEQVIAKHALQESENQFRNLVTQSPIAMTIFKGEELVIDMANHAMLDRLWRRTPEDVQGKKLLDVFPELEGQPFPMLLQKVYNTGLAHREKEALAYVDGPDGMRKFYLDYEYAPLFDLEKKVYAIMATVYDVTERKENEMALCLSEERFRMLGDSMPQLIWTMDKEGSLNYCSKKLLEFVGLEMDEILHHGLLRAIHPDDRAGSLEAWNAAVRSGTLYTYEHRFLKADGTVRWQLSRAVPHRGEDGNVNIWIGTSTDIHDGKLFIDELEAKVQERTKALQRSNDDLRRSNAELAQFAYVASHDLQEPLRKIQTFASRLVDTEFKNLSEKGKDYFARMQASSLHMRQLIEDLLAFSRTNNNGEQLFEYVDLSQVLASVKEQLSEQTEKKGALIHCDPLPVLAVIPYQIEQLFMNLLNNALKFSQVGVKPVIDIRMLDTEYTLIKGIPYHKITIADNGIGFDPQFSERIFQVFQRLHVRKEYEGTGIGLAICKKIMDNHNGFISATGKPDEGAVFTLMFPVG